jgi:hypothetical protein
MTPQQIDAIKLALEALEADELDMVDDGSGNMVFRKEQAITAIKEVLAEHAMRETQRLGQEIEQEPEEHRLLRRKWFGHRDTGHLSFTEAVDVTMEKIYSQPKQEPVAWMDADGNVSDNNDHKCFPIPLYTTAPPQRKPLTVAQIFACENSVPDEIVSDRVWCIYFARAIEAAHDIKENT